MKIKKITCKEVADYICETLGENLNSPKCKDIKEHLEHCEICNSYYKSVQETVQMYKQYKIKVSDDCHSRLMKYLDLAEFE